MITVILPSHNGARTLPLTLSAFQDLKKPSCGWELIVVDNVSNDMTFDIARAYEAVLPMRVLHESSPGKSVAANRGIEYANGDLILFTDDDILPDPEWLVEFDAAAKRYPEISIFGGQVRHYWEKQPPDWLLRLADEGRSYAGTPISLEEGPISVVHVKGPNFMVRREVLDVYKFDERPGINFTGQGSSQGGEETDLVKRALSGGYKLRHIPNARIKHIVRREQIGALPVFFRYVRIGRAGFSQNQEVSSYEGPRLFGYRRYLYKVVPVRLFRIVFLWFTGRRYNAANKLVDLGLVCGKAIEERHQWHRSQSRN